MKAVLLCLIVIFCVSSTLAVSVLKSKVSATLDDSVTTISQEIFENSTANDDVSAQVYGTFGSNFVNVGSRRFLAIGTETFYASASNTFLLTALFDVTDGLLDEKSRLFAEQGVGYTYSNVPPTSSLKYNAVSSYRPAIPIQSPFVPHLFLIELHSYDTNGIISETPSTIFNMATLHPHFYGNSISYNGLIGGSDDSKYLIGTYALGQYTGFIVGQKLHILQVNTDLSLTPIVSIDTSPTGIAHLYSFPQGARMWQDKDDPNIYHIISAENSWNFAFILGLTSQVVYYQFNVATGTIVRKSSVFAPQYIQGYGVDIVNNIVYAVTNGVQDGSPSITQDSRPPYFNSAEDKDFELRVMNLNTSAGELSYNGGIDLHEDGIQVEPCTDGSESIVAVTSAPIISNDLFPSPNNPLSPIARRYAPASHKLYRATGNVKLELQTSSSASPLPFGLAWSIGCRQHAVSGHPTHKKLTVGSQTRSTGQKDTQLYSISK